VTKACLFETAERQPRDRSRIPPLLKSVMLQT
jgi:hypothetical protein